MSNPGIPPWSDDMSDGCSIPHFLKPYVPTTDAIKQCCVKHDEKYYYGGTREERLIADLEFAINLVHAGMEEKYAEFWFNSVRMFGGPELRVEKVSWAFGGNVFKYTE